MNELDYNGNKGFRLLSIYERLNKGEILNKQSLSEEYRVSEKTVQRDIDDLRAYLCEEHMYEKDVAIRYNYTKHGYYLVRFEREWFTNEEVLALSKILLESRAFEKNELKVLMDKLLTQVVPEDKKIVDEMVRSEYACYVPLKHGKKLFEPLWQLSEAIHNNHIIEFSYTRQDGAVKNHRLKPVAIMFSEYYFYLIAFFVDDTKEYPTVFRVDRMERITETNEAFFVPYKNKFSDGEFRKRVQFMYCGELNTVTFEFTGPSVEAILDRLPTAEILSEDEGKYIIRAEAYGNGINMWLHSQGDWVRFIK